MDILREFSNASNTARIVETTEGRRIASPRMLGCPQSVLDRIAAKNAARTNYDPDNHYLPEEECAFCENEALPNSFVCEECKQFEYLLDAKGNLKDDAELLVDGKVPEPLKPSLAPLPNL